MKIAFLNITQGSVNRGVETFVRELSTRLAQHHKVSIISGDRVLPSRWPILWRFFIDPPGLLIGWWTLKQLPLLLRQRFDVVVPLNGGWQSGIVRIITWLYGGKMIISGQSGRGWDDRNNLWSFPNAFVALSNAGRSWAKKTNPLVHVEYIPNGTDIKKFKPKGLKINMGLGKPIILCVAALTEEKRVELVIQAVAKMESGSLLVVGSGPLLGYIQRLGGELLGDRFKLLQKSYDQLPPVYRVANVFTLPSPSYRSFEMVLVEAMATNIPVVANDDQIRREIIGDAGLFVEPTNTDEYVQALEKALDTNWGNKPRRQAEKFSWDKIATQYDKLFKQLVLSEAFD